MAMKIRKNVVHRGCCAGAGRTTSIGYSPSSPTKPGYGFPTKLTYALTCAVNRM